MNGWGIEGDPGVTRLKCAYRRRFGCIDARGVQFIRSAVVRMQRGETTLAMELNKIEKPLKLW